MLKIPKFFNSSRWFPARFSSPGRWKGGAVSGPPELPSLLSPGGGSGQGKWRQSLGVLMGMSAVGIEMGASVGIGIGVGYYLDRKLGTAPWLVFFFSACGLFAAGKALARLIRRLKRPLGGDDQGSES